MNEADTLFPACMLPHRGVVALGGADRVAFLQGLVTNDVRRAAGRQAVYAALLTPQGKFSHDIFIIAEPERFLLDVERARSADFVARLNKYKLRSAVTLEDISASYGVAVGGTMAGDGAFPDPRHAGLGCRMIAPRARLPAADAAALADYERQRLRLGVPDGSRDLVPGDSIWLEGNADFLNGVDFGKGCYLGQELTARTHYRTLIKKRLLPVRLTAPAFPGAMIFAGTQEAGMLRSVQDDYGLALLNLEIMRSGQLLRCGDAILTAKMPDWLQLP